MRAMILAAGRGERMRELTQYQPKPLLRVNDRHIIEYTIANLKRAGIADIVINVAYHGEQIKQALGDGQRYGVNICYSEEKERLEVGGGILNALPLLGNEPFLVVSGDIITDFPLANLPRDPKGLAHIIMVDNPNFHPHGDFGIQQGYINMQAQPRYTFGNIGVYRPEIFLQHEPGYFAWSKVMFPLIEKQLVTGEHYQGAWYNIGTPEDLAFINQRAREDSNLRPLASETNTLSS